MEAPHTDKHTLWLGGSFLIVALAVGFVSKYIFHLGVVRLMPVEDYGVFALIESIIMIAALITASAFPWVVAREIAGAGRKPLKAGLAGNVSIALIIFIALIVTILMRRFDLDLTEQIVIAAVGAILFFTSVSNVLQGALIGNFRFGLLALVRSSNPFIQAIVSIALAITGFGLAGVTIGYVAGSGVAVLIGIIACWRLILSGGSWFDKKIFLGAIPLLIGALGIQLIFQVDQIGVAFFSTEYMSAQYRAARLLAGIPFFATLALVGVLYPYVASLRDKSEDFTVVVSKFLLHVFFISLPYFLLLGLVPDFILGIVLPDNYIGAHEALTILAPAASVLCLGLVLSAALQASGRPVIVAVAISTGLVFQMILVRLLVPMLGLSGAALGTLTGATISLMSIVVLGRISFGLGTDYSSWLVLKAVFLGLALGVVMAVTSTMDTVPSVIVIGLSTVVYYAMLIKFKVVDRRTLLFWRMGRGRLT